jgi:hypothetical protein
MDNRNTPADAAAVTASDSTFVDFFGLYVGTGGDVAVVTAKGNAVTFSSVPGGTIIPLRITQVKSTGTTATSIVGFKAT